MTHSTAQKGNLPTLLTAAGFVLVASLPVLPFFGVLLRYAWYDTPQGYLIWIPVAAFASVFMGLHRRPPESRDLETDWIVALPILALAAVFFLWGPKFWPLFFLPNQMPFLVWPLWAIGTGFLFWGVESFLTWALPLCYLILVWPGWYGPLASFSQTVLVQWAGFGLSHLLPFIHGTHYVAGATPQVLFTFHGRTASLAVGSSCSGSDMLAGLYLFFLPFLPFWEGSLPRKLLFLILLFPAALFTNLLRLFLLTLSGLWFGSAVAFGWVHPLDGPILFLLLSWLLLSTRRWIPRGEVRPAAPVPSGGRSQLVLGVLGLGLAAALFLNYHNDTFAADPTSLANDTWSAQAMPVPGYRVNLWDELALQTNYGAGSRDYILRYRPRRGLSTWINTITTPEGGALLAYSFAACMHFHNDQVVTHQVLLAPSLTAQLDRVHYLDDPRIWYVLYWQWPVRVGQKLEWQRVAIQHTDATPPGDLIRFGKQWIASLEKVTSAAAGA